MNRILLAVLALPALLLPGCGPVLFADLEVPKVCSTLQDQEFPGVSTGALLVKDLSYDLATDLPVVNEHGVDVELRLTELELGLTSTSGVGDLGAIQTVIVEVLPPAGSALAPFEAVRYVRGADLHPTAIVATGRSNVDLSPYLEAGQLVMRATASGSLPDTSWRATVRGCFYFKAKLDYGSYLPL